MPLLIDGYNLLHATGIVGRGLGPGSLERSRRALLNFLCESIDPRHLPRTTIVFDSKDAPPGLPDQEKHGPMTVLYSRDFEDADAQIEFLIKADTAPRRLLVVSSDHRLQRAAARRRAQFIDSDVWYAQLIEQRRHHGEPKISAPLKPPAPLSESEVEYWLAKFTTGEPPTDEENNPSGQHEPHHYGGKQDETIYNPFPPGYAEEIGDEEEL